MYGVFSGRTCVKRRAHKDYCKPYQKSYKVENEACFVWDESRYGLNELHYGLNELHYVLNELRYVLNKLRYVLNELRYERNETFFEVKIWFIWSHRARDGAKCAQEIGITKGKVKVIIPWV